MRSLRLPALLLLACAAPPAFAQSAPDPAAGVQSAVEAKGKRADIRRLLVLMGSEQLAVQMIDQMMDAFKQQLPQVPADFWVEVKAEMDPVEILDMTAAVYERHFTRAEIGQLIAFYESPIGRKLVAEMPAISRESMEAGTVWGRAAAERAQRKLKDRGQ